MATRYEFSWTENEQQFAFGLYGISADVANGICAGLQVVPTVSNVIVNEFTETVENVTRLSADLLPELGKRIAND